MPTEFKNEEEVHQLFRKTRQQIIIFEGSVFDITEYKDHHPGGGILFDDYLGKSIDEAYLDENHSKAARNVFRDLPLVGYIAGSNGANQSMTGFAGTQLESKLKLDHDRGMVD